MKQGRRFSVVLGAVVALGAFTAGLGGTASAMAAQADVRDVYVALGDSFASGNGAGEYDPDSADCHRSALSYSKVWAGKYPTIPTYSFACSGATTDNVLIPPANPLDEQRLKNALVNATLVSVTVGGNDIGFADTIKKCLLSNDQGCMDHINTAVRPAIEKDLPAKLDTLYKRIRELAPTAGIQVIGYPYLFSDGDSCTKNKWSPAKRKVLNDATDLLADTIAYNAKTAGFSFRDTRPAFAGHGICGTDPWVHNFGEGSHLWEFFHPTAAGHAAMASGLSAPTPIASGAYVTAENAGTAPLIANRTELGPWERFILKRQPDATVTLFARANNKYVTAENAGSAPLIASRYEVGPWEKFELVHNLDGSYSFRSLANGRYVTAENAGTASLIANRDAVGPWEKFALVYNKYDGTTSIQSLANR